MANRKEIEMKLYVGADASSLMAKLAELGWKQTEREDQEDIYYTSKHNDFIKTEECLRVRITPTFEQVTWKPPTSRAMRERGQYWKQEINVDITGQSDKIRLMLRQLDFVEYVAVKKHRLVFRADLDSIVALDMVEPLGWFVEIETFAYSPTDGTRKNDEIAHLLGIHECPQINIPYRDLVKAGRVYSAVGDMSTAHHAK
ncbi:MAG: class IV adenylate cyclase [Candidatus Aenigmarchaeota archaeon]|nr:class IV adenylate cyclase [Candidatus Wildermuthbacteria bacterium]MBI2578931.1 class IV adenylate cyclase [Candidatus Aenigmarchaeota archaeon]